MNGTSGAAEFLVTALSGFESNFGVMPAAAMRPTNLAKKLFRVCCGLTGRFVWLKAASQRREQKFECKPKFSCTDCLQAELVIGEKPDACAYRRTICRTAEADLIETPR